MAFLRFTMDAVSSLGCEPLSSYQYLKKLPVLSILSADVGSRKPERRRQSEMVNRK